ncbi:MAG: hypothetical protein WCB27_23370 [Thermoguttaceae bacterium]
MRQPGHRRGEPARKPQLARHEVDGERQHRRRQNLLADRVEQILRRHALLHPFAQRAKEVCLFDVFFPVQRHVVFPLVRIIPLIADWPPPIYNQQSAIPF